MDPHTYTPRVATENLHLRKSPKPANVRPTQLDVGKKNFQPVCLKTTSLWDHVAGWVYIVHCNINELWRIHLRPSTSLVSPLKGCSGQ